MAAGFPDVRVEIAAWPCYEPQVAPSLSKPSSTDTLDRPRSSLTALTLPEPGLSEEYALDSVGDSQPHLQVSPQVCLPRFTTAHFATRASFVELALSALGGREASECRDESEVGRAETFKSQYYVPDPLDLKLKAVVYSPWLQHQLLPRRSAALQQS